MKKINDSRLYLYFIIITFCMGIVLGLIFSYSSFIVEPEIKELMSSEDNVDENFKKAYQKLKDPQIFARYENFDISAMSIKTIINVYDKKIENNEMFDKNDKIYLQILFNRRELGSLLTRNTMIFFFLLSILGSVFYFFELNTNKRNLIN